jgi:hypothetical protein
MVEPNWVLRGIVHAINDRTLDAGSNVTLPAKEIVGGGTDYVLIRERSKQSTSRTYSVGTEGKFRGVVREVAR